MPLISVLELASQSENLPIYEQLMFIVTQYLTDVNDGLKATDEVSIFRVDS